MAARSSLAGFLSRWPAMKAITGGTSTCTSTTKASVSPEIRLAPMERARPGSNGPRSRARPLRRPWKSLISREDQTARSFVWQISAVFISEPSPGDSSQRMPRILRFPAKRGLIASRSLFRNENSSPDFCECNPSLPATLPTRRLDSLWIKILRHDFSLAAASRALLGCFFAFYGFFCLVVFFVCFFLKSILTTVLRSTRLILSLLFLFCFLVISFDRVVSRITRPQPRVRVPFRLLTRHTRSILPGLANG